MVTTYAFSVSCEERSILSVCWESASSSRLISLLNVRELLLDVDREVIVEWFIGIENIHTFLVWKFVLIDWRGWCSHPPFPGSRVFEGC